MEWLGFRWKTVFDSGVMRDLLGLLIYDLAFAFLCREGFGENCLALEQETVYA